jgi:hypothetical protein
MRPSIVELIRREVDAGRHVAFSQHGIWEKNAQGQSTDSRIRRNPVGLSLPDISYDRQIRMLVG